MNQTKNKNSKAMPYKWTVLDRVINHFDPARGQRRLQARMTTSMATGGYVGGSRSRRQTREWSTSSNDADGDLLPDISILRERCRDLIRNVPLATGAANTICTNVIGTGLKLQSRIDRDVLNLTEEEANKWEADAERLFRLWSESQECDMSRTLTFNGIQELAFRSAFENGDVFAILPHKKRKGVPFDLRVQLIEADRVCNDGGKADTSILSGGVERDTEGAPIKYHVMQQHPGRVFKARSRQWKQIPAFGVKTGRRNIIHLYRMLRPGQTRGVPGLAPVIELFKQLSRYTDAETMAAVINSFFTVFVKTEDGDSGLSPMEPTSDVGGSSSDEDMKLGSGAIVDLAPGESIESADPKRPNTAFDPFVQALLRQIGVALELPFEILIKHFTSSYSAARASLLEAWKFFSARRQWMATNFCQPIYEAWLEEAITKKHIAAPGFFTNPLIRKAYSDSVWIGPARGMIDEFKEIKAAALRVEMGVSTLSEETAQLTGGDWDKKHTQRTKESKLRREAGLEATIDHSAISDEDADKDPDDNDNKDKKEIGK